MRKNDKQKAKKQRNPPLLAPLAARVLQIGMLLIYAVMLGLIREILSAGELTQAAADDFFGMLEYPVAAIALLTASTFLIDRVMKNT